MCCVASKMRKFKFELYFTLISRRFWSCLDLYSCFLIISFSSNFLFFSSVWRNLCRQSALSSRTVSRSFCFKLLPFFLTRFLGDPPVEVEADWDDCLILLWYPELLRIDDFLRLSDFGPDFRFSETDKAAAVCEVDGLFVSSESKIIVFSLRRD